MRPAPCALRADVEPRTQPTTQRSSAARAIRVSALLLSAIAVVAAGVTLYSWIVNEEHFARPSAAFDALEDRIGSLPGVVAVEKERWVEAPTFSQPTSWMRVEVEQSGLRGLLDAACSSDYPDPVSWSVTVTTPSAAEVSMHSAEGGANQSGSAAPCPDFGFDAVRVVDVLDRVAPGLALQPSVWEDGQFALVSLDDGTASGLADLLPLLGHVDEIAESAGRDRAGSVEVNSPFLAVTIADGESDEYVALLRELVEDHSVTSFWADDSGTQVDGVERVQIVAPTDDPGEIERALRASGLAIADLPVRFLAQ